MCILYIFSVLSCFFCTILVRKYERMSLHIQGIELSIYKYEFYFYSSK